MKATEDIKPVSYIKNNAATVLNQINVTHRPIYITQNGEAKGVLVDTESFESMKDALGILKLVTQGETDIKNRNFKSQSTVFKKIEKRFHFK